MPQGYHHMSPQERHVRGNFQVTSADIRKQLAPLQKVLRVDENAHLQAPARYVNKAVHSPRVDVPRRFGLG